MNIFYLDPNPRTCAEMHCDKHVVKMIIEYAQLLSTAHRVLDGVPERLRRETTGRQYTRYTLSDNRDGVLYSATHINHPSAIWVREDEKHYRWLFLMWTELLDEYTHRYGKIHACVRLQNALSSPPFNIPYGNAFFAPTPAMPQELKIESANPVPGRKYDVLASYKNYYIKDKARFAKWKNRNTPEWFAQNANV
jgi:hypothetical protein